MPQVSLPYYSVWILIRSTLDTNYTKRLAILGCGKACQIDCFSRVSNSKRHGCQKVTRMEFYPNHSQSRNAHSRTPQGEETTSKPNCRLKSFCPAFALWELNRSWQCKITAGSRRFAGLLPTPNIIQYRRETTCIKRQKSHMHLSRNYDSPKKLRAFLSFSMIYHW